MALSAFRARAQSGRCLWGAEQGGAVRPHLFLPAALLPRGTNAQVAETVLTRGLGRRSEMAEEALPSAKWLYCGEPDESQRAVLGKDCGAGAVPRNSHFRLGTVTALPPPRRTLFPAGSKSPLPPPPLPATSPRPAASVYHYLGLGQSSSVIPPSFTTSHQMRTSL